jgi:predicted site-specific integrase-resolvase
MSDNRHPRYDEGMPLDYAWQTLFHAVREAVSSELPLRRRLDALCASSVDKLANGETLREDIVERIAQVRQARHRIAALSDEEVRGLLEEIVSIYDAISAELYGSHPTKTVAR